MKLHSDNNNYEGEQATFLGNIILTFLSKWGFRLLALTKAQNDHATVSIL
jgi:hypothetical protein